MWSVHGSKSHTRWATSRAPLTDKSGLGEISFDVLSRDRPSTWEGEAFLRPPLPTAG
jgi:hypothetical protein